LHTITPLLSLRRLMAGTRSSGRSRLQVWAVLAFIMVAQAVALTHLIGHTAQGDNAHCAICINASDAGNAIPATPIQFDIQKLADRPAVPVITGQISSSPSIVYRSRAPPALV
jgi:hypothetical protein